MTRAPAPLVGPALRSGSSPLQQTRPSARRCEDITTPNGPLGESMRPSAGRLLILVGCALLATLRWLKDQQQPSPAMQQLAAAEEQRFAQLCQQITHARQGVQK